MWKRKELTVKSFENIGQEGSLIITVVESGRSLLKGTVDLVSRF